MNVNKTYRYLEKAEIYYQEEEYFKSKTCYELVYELDKGLMDEQDLLQFGLTLDCLNEQGRALEIFEEVLKVDEESYPAYYAKGMILEDLNRPKEALENYMKAVDIYPEYKEALFNIAGLHDDSKELELANQYYQKAIDIDPNYFWAIMNLGSNFEKTGKDLDALELFERALCIKRHPNVLFNLGVVYSKLGQRERSIEFYEQAQELDDNNPYIYLNWSLQYAKKRDWDKVISILNEGINLCKNNGFLHYHKACALAHQYNGPEVIKEFLLSYSTNPVFFQEALRDPDLKDFLPKIKISVNQYDQEKKKKARKPQKRKQETNQT